MSDKQKFPQHLPLIVNLIFYMTKAASNKTDFPAQKPDRDRLENLIVDVLKEHCCHDDDQIIGGMTWKFWADEKHPPGVEITVLPAVEYNPQAELSMF